jgi:hypothetical protein
MLFDSSITKIQVVAPTGLVTGGPESLHNLVYQIGKFGLNSEIVYFPFGRQYEVTKGYERYTKHAHDIDDISSALIVLPETLCMLGFTIKHARVAIWWLSVDHFTQTKYYSFRDYFRYLRLAVRRQRPYGGVKSLKKFIHLSKSTYDEEFLAKNQIEYMRLTGPISEDFLTHIPKHQERKNVILFNPKKGKDITDLLKNNFKQFTFLPLSNMSNSALMNAYSSSKLYIDFGNHPGKERMPREATLLGCCIITGVLGSSQNDTDIPIPKEFKINSNDEDFLNKFEQCVSRVFYDFETTSRLYDHYRNTIKTEPIHQLEDLHNIFTNLSLNKQLLK